MCSCLLHFCIFEAQNTWNTRLCVARCISRVLTDQSTTLTQIKHIMVSGTHDLRADAARAGGGAAHGVRSGAQYQAGRAVRGVRAVQPRSGTVPYTLLVT